MTTRTKIMTIGMYAFLVVSLVGMTTVHASEVTGTLSSSSGNVASSSNSSGILQGSVGNSAGAAPANGPAVGTFGGGSQSSSNSVGSGSSVTPAPVQNPTPVPVFASNTVVPPAPVVGAEPTAFQGTLTDGDDLLGTGGPDDSGFGSEQFFEDPTLASAAGADFSGQYQTAAVADSAPEGLSKWWYLFAGLLLIPIAYFVNSRFERRA